MVPQSATIVGVVASDSVGSFGLVRRVSGSASTFEMQATSATVKPMERSALRRLKAAPRRVDAGNKTRLRANHRREC